jgi:molybdenum cofactor guanylyltransferase
MSISNEEITAVILAGGRGRRMGGVDKGLVNLGGRALIEYVLAAIAPQAGAVLINANRNLERYQCFGHPVLSDELSDYQGPLAGFHTALQASSTPYIITLPCDGPLLPTDYVERMKSALELSDAELAVAHDGTRLQPVYALIPRALIASLAQYLARGDRKIELWYGQHRVTLADFTDSANAFRNINTPADRDRLLQEGPPRFTDSAE